MSSIVRKMPQKDVKKHQMHYFNWSGSLTENTANGFKYIQIARMYTLNKKGVVGCNVNYVTIYALSE